MSDEIYFKPWVGKNYQSGGIFGRRILTVGNSHYCDHRSDCKACGIVGGSFSGNLKYSDVACQDYTADTVESCYQTYWNYAKALAGHEIEAAEYEQIFDSIAMYNFLQTAVGNATDQGNDQDYKNSAGAFWTLLEELRPERIIIWGNRAWDSMPQFNSPDKRAYMLQDGTTIPALYIHHPSIGFAWQKWHGEIREFVG